MAAKRNVRRSFAGLLIRLIIVLFCLSAWKSPIVFAQAATSPKNDCSAVENPPTLKEIKMISATYSDEAMQKKIEGTVVVCVTVDAQGKVTNASV